MIEINEQEIQSVSGGVEIPGYPVRDPIEDDPLHGSETDPTVKMQM
ncbi:MULTISPECIES: hypothetical protein [unclassified Janthinobacterium]|nr:MULTISPECIES: hypothetical protein [unclassified Janthinobacterium]MBB5371335.1 hypothetical protein [Janthinobacterium sp. K2C7]MBB5384141.1 hypothetical protein [Janthinobacterium sp. K2Li3]MBB5389399.1 hypothetical protein [Janthinobacterium sp. K2E3]